MEGRGEEGTDRESATDVYTTTYKIDSWREAATQHSELSWVLCDALEGWNAKEESRVGRAGGAVLSAAGPTKGACSKRCSTSFQNNASNIEQKCPSHNPSSVSSLSQQCMWVSFMGAALKFTSCVSETLQ